MIKIEGKIQNLAVEDSKILSIESLGKQATNSALIGTLVGSTTLLSNAPIMMMAARGINAKTFTAEVNGIPIIGQFTTLKFEENMPLIFVISEEKEQGYHLAYAVLEPKKGILHMVYEMGRSIKKGYKDVIETGLFFFLLFSICIIFYSIYIWFDEGRTFNAFKELLPFFIYSIVFAFVSVFVFVAFWKPAKLAGGYSEQIFEALKFEHIKNQDFYNDCSHEDGRSLSVMKYRKSLKGKDPYSENYFDMKNDKN